MKYEVCYEVNHYEVRLYDSDNHEVIGARMVLENEEDAVECLKRLRRTYPDRKASLFRIERSYLICEE